MFTASKKERIYAKKRSMYDPFKSKHKTKQNKQTNKNKKELKTKTKNNHKNLIELLKCCYGKKQIHTAAPKKKKNPSLHQVLICMC